MGRYVSPVGPANAKIALVGEAPGRDEEKAGIPFVGASGQLLNQMLGEAGLTRSEVWVTNVIKERPPGNNIKVHFIDAKCTKPKATMERALEQLKEELERINPNVVVAIGDTALWALTGLRNITKRRGSIYESTLVPGMKVVASLHPAYVLRNWSPWRYIIPVDLRRAVEESESKELVRPERNYLIGPKFYEVMEELERLKNEAEFISFDIETRGPVITCIGLSDDPSRAICIPFMRGMTHYWEHIDDEEKIWLSLAELLAMPDKKKVAQNAQYDILYLARYAAMNTLPGLWMDTMVAHHELYPETPRGLDFLTSIWTREPYYKDEGKEVGGRVKDADLWTYNCKDAAVTLEVAHRLHEELIEEDLWDQYKETQSYMEPLMTMSLMGVNFDRKNLSRLDKEFEAKASEAQAKLDEVVGYPLNVRSHPQMVKYLYGELALKARIGKTGRPTADDKALRYFRKYNPNPAFDLILDIRRFQKIRSTYLGEGMADYLDGRIRCSYDVAGTTTWRLSSKSSIFGGGTNLQNIPKRADKSGGVRNLFVPDEGKFMFAIDLSQAEARVVSWLCEDEVQIHDFESGEVDVHSAYAARLFQISYEAMMELKVTDRDDYEYKRNMGKVLRHATNYGMSWVGLQQVLEGMDIFMQAKQCKALLALASESAPMLKHWHASTREQLAKNRTLWTPYGKRRTFGERWGNDLFKQGYAFVPQSFVGQATNRGLTRIYNELATKDVNLLLQVHDEVVGQAPIEKPLLAWRARELMEEELIIKDRPLLIPAELSVGMSWGNLEEVNSVESLESAVARCLSEIHG